MNKLTKIEWTKKIKSEAVDATGTNCFWVSEHSMMLSPLGFEMFKKANIPMAKITCNIPQWKAAIILGLCRMDCPFYYQRTNEPGFTYDFYIQNDEYAMLLMFMNNDINQFAREFLRERDEKI